MHKRTLVKAAHPEVAAGKRTNAVVLDNPEHKSYSEVDLKMEIECLPTLANGDAESLATREGGRRSMSRSRSSYRKAQQVKMATTLQDSNDALALGANMGSNEANDESPPEPQPTNPTRHYFMQRMNNVPFQAQVRDKGSRIQGSAGFTKNNTVAVNKSMTERRQFLCHPNEGMQENEQTDVEMMSQVEERTTNPSPARKRRRRYNRRKSRSNDVSIRSLAAIATPNILSAYKQGHDDQVLLPNSCGSCCMSAAKSSLRYDAMENPLAFGCQPAEYGTQKSLQTLNRLLSTLSDLNLTQYINQSSLCLEEPGGYSNIYTCHLLTTGSLVKVAVKRLRVNLRNNLQFAKRVTREIRIWSKVKHPNILPLLGFSLESECIPSLITRWMVNGTVLEFVKRDPAIDICPMVLGIASGIDHLHSCNIVHADLKSDNIVISPDCRPLIMDFGLSHLILSTSTFETATRADKGSIRWMATELFLGTGETAPEDDVHTMMSDVWAFGMTVLELLTKRRPYHHLKTDVQVMFAISSYTLPSPPEAESWDDCYLYLWEICRRCWARAPSERPNMADLSQEVAKLVTI